MKPNKAWIKRGPLKTFLFFLAFSAVIWLFVQFSKKYTVTVEFPVTYLNVPKDRILLEKPGSLDVSVRANGFMISYYRLLSPKLQLDISEAAEQDGELVFDLQQQKAGLLSQLDANYENFSFHRDVLQLPFEQREVKKVPVLSGIELSFAPGYSAVSGVALQPDSIRVSGPANILDTLQAVKTKSVKINNISQDISGNVKVDRKGLDKVTLYQEEIRYTVNTDKFTEGKAEVPIELINVPENINVTIFPREVVVYYQVSLDKFDEVKPADFRVVADFSKAERGDGYLLAQLVQQPEVVNNVRLNEKKIQFVIKR